MHLWLTVHIFPTVNISKSKNLLPFKFQEIPAKWRKKRRLGENGIDSYYTFLPWALIKERCIAKRALYALSYTFSKQVSRGYMQKYLEQRFSIYLHAVATFYLYAAATFYLHAAATLENWTKYFPYHVKVTLFSMRFEHFLSWYHLHASPPPKIPMHRQQRPTMTSHKLSIFDPLEVSDWTVTKKKNLKLFFD